MRKKLEVGDIISIKLKAVKQHPSCECEGCIFERMDGCMAEVDYDCNKKNYILVEVEED